MRDAATIERAEKPTTADHVQGRPDFGAVSKEGNRLVAQQRQAATVPAEFGKCELYDSRSTAQKAADFGSAAFHRATDLNGWRKWATDEQQKILGIGEGLNTAKEEFKAAAVNTAQAVVDGHMVNAIAHAPETLQTTATAAGHVLETLTHDAQAPERAVNALGAMISKASADYSALSPREQGKVIGKATFAGAAAEACPEAASVALKAADNVATHIDAAVMNGIRKSMQAIEDTAKTSPELAQQAKQMLWDYTKNLGVNPRQLEAAGVPPEYWSGVKSANNTHESFYAAAKKDPLENWKPADEAYRGDKKPHSAIDEAGRRKSHLNMDGDLCPANPKGVYNGQEVTVGHHLDGNWNSATKANSPFTSFSREGDIAKWGNTKITLNVKELRAAIASGEVKGVEILERPEILKRIDESPFKDSAKDKFRARAIKHDELMIKGKIPARFLTVEP